MFPRNPTANKRPYIFLFSVLLHNSQILLGPELSFFLSCKSHIGYKSQPRDLEKFLVVVSPIFDRCVPRSSPEVEKRADWTDSGERIGLSAVASEISI